VTPCPVPLAFPPALLTLPFAFSNVAKAHKSPRPAPLCNQNQFANRNNNPYHPPMAYFLCKLIPPRPTFAQDMSAEERAIMQQHVAYWTKLADEDIAIAFGPVADPAGVWGVGILQVETEAEAQAIRANDPTMKPELAFKFEILAMPRLILRT
jgi:uncharacterized protein YciI